MTTNLSTSFKTSNTKYSMNVSYFFILLYLLFLTQFACFAGTMTPKSIVTNSESAPDTLQTLAEPIMFDDNGYGCGPLLEPQREFYVTMTGDDQNDGLTRSSAWRTLERAIPELTAGDTLWIDEGEYIEPQLEINVRFAQSGEPGKPIRIMALPERLVIVSGAPRLSDFTRAPKWRYLWATA